MVGSTQFLTINCDQIDRNKIRSLTPLVMNWKENLWLFDLSPCTSYWRSYAHRSGLDQNDMWQKLIQSYLSIKEYQAVLAPHPWQCILLNKLLQERNLQGFVNIATPFGENLYEQISWDNWWESVDCFLKKIDLHYKKNEINIFNRNIFRMKKSLEKLKINTPKSFSELGTSAIKRRYGYLMAQLWQWYDKNSQNHWFNNLDSFPFKNIETIENPSCTRTIDYPISSWEHIEPLLNRDLNQLSHHKKYTKNLMILSLEWQITLKDLHSFNIPILFRYPYDLSQNCPAQVPALLQAYYNFIKICKIEFKRYLEIDTQPPPITSWTITITSSMVSSAKFTDIFDTDHKDITNLQNLENQLPIPLISYYISEDWLPEKTISSKPIQGIVEDTPHKNILINASRNRPLFILKNFQDMGASVTSALWRFQERVMDKWWQQNQKNLQRDYYIMVDEQHRHLWVFKDSSGKWFIHGIFA